MRKPTEINKSIYKYLDSGILTLIRTESQTGALMAEQSQTQSSANNGKKNRKKKKNGIKSNQVKINKRWIHYSYHGNSFWIEILDGSTLAFLADAIWWQFVSDRNSSAKRLSMESVKSPKSSSDQRHRVVSRSQMLYHSPLTRLDGDWIQQLISSERETRRDAESHTMAVVVFPKANSSCRSQILTTASHPLEDRPSKRLIYTYPPTL